MNRDHPALSASRRRRPEPTLDELLTRLNADRTPGGGASTPYRYTPPPSKGAGGGDDFAGCFVLILLGVGIFMLFSPRRLVLALLAVAVVGLMVFLYRNRRTAWMWIVPILGIAAVRPAWDRIPNEWGGKSPYEIRNMGDRLVAAVDDVPPLDFPQFLRNRLEREQQVKEYPNIKEPVLAAERNWVRRSRAKLIEDVGRLDLDDGPGLQRLVAQYEQLDGLQLLPADAKTKSDWSEAKTQWTARAIERDREAYALIDAGRVEKLLELRAKSRTKWGAVLDKEIVPLIPTQDRLEEDWVRRTTTVHAGRLKELAPDAFAGVVALREEGRKMSDQVAALKTPMREAEWAWAGRSMDAVAKEAAGIRDKEPMRSLLLIRERLAALEKAGFDTKDGTTEAKAMRERALPARRLSVEACLNEARRRTKPMQDALRYQAAAKVADDLFQSVSADAGDVGLIDEVTKYRDACRFLARFALEAGKPDPP